jgi:hypothetical protein
MVIDRAIWQSYGAVALRWTGDYFTQTVARPRSEERRWTHRARAISENAEPARRQSSRGAEPRQEDLTPDD